MYKKICFALVSFVAIASWSQPSLDKLTVEKIMRDPKWIGTSPSNVFWSPDSKTIYFSWNPVNAAGDSLYKATLQNPVPVKVEKPERRILPVVSPFNPPQFSYIMLFNKSRTKALFEKNGDIFIYDLTSKNTFQITNTSASESSPTFSKDEKKFGSASSVSYSVYSMA